MPRSVEEWIGKTDDARVPPRVRLRVFDRDNGVCCECKIVIKPGETWQCDHRVALVNGGEHRETNLAPIHAHCHLGKTSSDVKLKAKVAAVRQRHLGIVDTPKLRGQPFPKTSKSARREKHGAEKRPLSPKSLFWQPPAPNEDDAHVGN